MRRVILISSLLISSALWSQGDNCSNAHSIILDGVYRNYSVSPVTGSAMYCTMSGYSGSNGRVTYFTFTTNNTAECIILEIQAGTITTMELVLFDGCNSGNAVPVNGLDGHSMCMNSGSGIWAQNLYNNLSPNTTYYLRMRTEGGYADDIKISGRNYTPPNDNCTGATSIGTTPLDDNNACHTPSNNVPASQLCAITLENTAWYTYVVENTGTSTIIIDNIACNNGNGNNSNGFQIGFFRGNCASLIPVTCSSGAGGTVSASALSMPAGTRMYVGIDGYSGSNCTYTVRATNAVPLPVRLKSFAGWKTLTSNMLKWITLDEENLNYFEIQRSTDGTNFSTIGKIYAQNTASPEKMYTYEDESPPQQCFYRLLQMNLDGNASYSRILSLSRNGTPLVKLYPPGNIYQRLDLKIVSSHKAKMQVVITDMSGKLLGVDWVQCIDGTTNFSKDLSQLSSGQYMVNLIYERQRITQPFLKNGRVYNHQ